MSLKNLLMAATGFLGRGAFFQWCLAVSDALGSSSTPPDYAYAKNSAQAGITTNTNITLDNNGVSRGITRPGGSQTVFQLTPGKTYLLEVGGYFDTFSNTTGGVITLDWVDENNTRLNSGNVDAASGQFYPTTNTNPQSSGGMPPLLYTAGAGALARVKLRCTGATGTAALSSAQLAVTITEIPG